MYSNINMHLYERMFINTLENRQKSRDMIYIAFMSELIDKN